MALCASCNAPMHDFAVEEALGCVPPRGVLVFTTHTLDPDYRAALLHEHPQFTVEEIVGSSLGHCPHFPSQDDWLCDVKNALRYRIIGDTNPRTYMRKPWSFVKSHL